MIEERENIFKRKGNDVDDVSDLRKQLLDFIDGKVRNKWLASKSAKIYVRKSLRTDSKGSFEDCLDLATIEIDETECGKGLGTSIAKMVAAVAHENGCVMVVENVMNEGWGAKLKECGWTIRVFDGITETLEKRIGMDEVKNKSSNKAFRR